MGDAIDQYFVSDCKRQMGLSEVVDIGLTSDNGLPVIVGKSAVTGGWLVVTGYAGESGPEYVGVDARRLLDVLVTTTDLPSFWTYRLTDGLVEHHATRDAATRSALAGNGADPDHPSYYLFHGDRFLGRLFREFGCTFPTDPWRLDLCDRELVKLGEAILSRARRGGPHP